MLRDMPLLRQIRQLIYPPACLLCHQRLSDEAQIFCDRCVEQMPPIGRPVCPHCGTGLPGAYDAQLLCATCRSSAPSFDMARAPWWYRGAVQEAVRQFKYHRRWRIGRQLADDMAVLARSSLPVERIDAILPVPRHWLKSRARGFNPAALLADSVAHALGKPLATHALRQTRWTSTQTRLHGRDRFRNVRRAFAARERFVRNQRLLLIDDVLTSGATADACAQALKQAGARQVFVLTAARTPIS